MRRYFLIDLHKSLVNELDWLTSEFEQKITRLRDQPNDRADRLACEMAIIRLHDCWARFSRELIVLSAGACPFTARGSRLPLAPNIKSLNEVNPVLMSTFKKRSIEPSWARPIDAIDAAQRLKIANYHTVAAALGALNLPAEEIRPLRNFFAHRAINTALEVK